MAKRRLSKNQSRRIKRHQKASIDRVSTQADINDEELGPEKRGRIVAHYGQQVSVEDVGGSDSVRCFVRANLDALATGDHVIWRQGSDGTGVVVSRLERQSLLCRPDSYGKLKPIAANVDQILVTIAPEPMFFTNLIDRYIVVAEINNIRPVILVNKSDLISENLQEVFDQLHQLYQSLGYDVMSVCAKQQKGLEALKISLANRTSIFVGQSGVGKSSIIQQLKPDENIEVGELSQARIKGRHTTTHSHLFHFEEGGECIDSPGIREFGLWHLTPEDVMRGFIELYDHSGKCRFRDCRHEREPGCAIIAAVESGEASPQRFESYKRIIASLNDVEINSNNDML